MVSVPNKLKMNSFSEIGGVLVARSDSPTPSVTSHKCLSLTTLDRKSSFVSPLNV